ncbi:MAG: class I SAM-dependent RNA methyltransferase [Lachnospiraceae bacterium]|nr:class I SAM-dependent RNA methyltransferase [Lachnospiraceae bacterium]
MQFFKNQTIQLEITDLNTDGEGIGKVDGFPFFIKDTVPGDVVTATVMKMKKNYGYARLLTLLTPSPDRVEPVCPQHRACGGCQLQTLSYEKQMEFKENKIANNLRRIGGLSDKEVEAAREPFVGMGVPFHYRNKAQYPVGKDKDGKTVCGFYAGRTHTIISNTDCALGAEENEEILRAVLAHMDQYHIAPYDETSGHGLVRHILIRSGFESGRIMVCLVVNLSPVEWEKCGWERLKAGELVERLCGLRLSADNDITCGDECRNTKGSGKNAGYVGKQANQMKRDILDMENGQAMVEQPANSGERNVHGREMTRRICSISVNFNTRRDNVIMGDTCRTLWGSDTIEDSLYIRDVSNDFARTGDFLTFHISPLSFYQVNPRQTEKLYSIALDYAALTGRETVWDLYCGIGTISLFMACRAGLVCGVEVVPQAIDDARANAAANGITNATFYVGKAEKVLPAFYEKYHGEEEGMPDCEPMEGNAAEKFRASASDGAASEKNPHMRTASATVLTHPDVIVVDPPRKGCDQACLDTMLQMQPDRIVYVSCDSATLARNIKYLREGGYELKKWRGVDQFGQTVHCECATLMTRKE